MTAAEEQGSLPYEKAKEMARSTDPAVRRALAERSDLRPELLYFLAEDASPEVRRAAAANDALPAQAGKMLACDPDEGVREGLAEKIAKLAPGLSANEQDRLRRTAYETLETLARDQMTRVRQILSDTLKEVADAPNEVIRTLARDAEIVVSGPVLEYSPVLTDDDLLEIIEHGPAQGGVAAIARRQEVSERVSDAVVGTDDVEAIADLLGNDSAQIREETLDDLIDRAPSVELWHAPLVHRPKLSNRAAGRLAQFVADNLLEALEQRNDLDAETLETVKTMMHRRLEQDGGEGGGEGRPEFLAIDPPVAVARRLHDAGKLDSKVVGKALHASDHAFVLAALAVMSGLPLAVIKKVFEEKSAKGVLAICWKAQLPVRMAVQVEQRMARIAPSEVIDSRDGRYPLSSDEMAWQLDFFRRLAQGRR